MVIRFIIHDQNEFYKKLGIVNIWLKKAVETMTPEKKSETIWSYDLYVILASPFIFPILLMVVATYERSFSVFYEIGFLLVAMTPIMPLIAILKAPLRRTKIDYQNKTVTIREWHFQRILIPQGSLRRVVCVKNAFGFTYAIMHCLVSSGVKEYEWYFCYYSTKNRRKIMDALIEFNPWVEKPEGF